MLVVQAMKFMKVEAKLFAAKMELYVKYQANQQVIAALQTKNAQMVIAVLQVKYMIMVCAVLPVIAIAALQKKHAQMVCAVIQMPVMAIAALKMKYVRKIVMEIMHVVVLVVVVLLVGKQGISVVKCHVLGILPFAGGLLYVNNRVRPDILITGSGLGC